MTVLSHSRATTFTTTRRGSGALAYLPLTVFSADVIIVALSTVVGVLGRLHLDIFASTGDEGVYIGWAFVVIIIGWPACIFAAGGYRRNIFGSGPDEFKRVINASLITAGLVGVVCYLAKFSLSRGFFMLTFAFGIPALVLTRYLIRRVLKQARRNGALRNRVIIAGSPGHVDEIAAVLRRESWLGYEVIGALSRASDDFDHTPSGIPVLGSTRDIATPVTNSEANLVFFAGGAVSSGKELRRIAWTLEKEDVQVVVAPSVTEVSGDRVDFRPVAGLPLIHVESPRALDAARWGKRAFDVLGSAALIVLLSPLFLFAALQVRLHDGGPILFAQRRVGKDGQDFNCLKFRSMVVDANKIITPEMVEQAVSGGGLFKLKDDPRITKPGHWLRRFSVDELPQLFNVLRGDMSLVGPRPALRPEVEAYHSDAERRLDVRPGMTGLWQVSGRSDLSWDETIRLDLYYVDNWSMLQDLNILLKTVGAVIRPNGAY